MWSDYASWRLAEFDVTRLCLLIASTVAMPAVHAHGIAGNRYFPGTLTFDDPAVADELILPNFSSTKHPLGKDDICPRTRDRSLEWPWRPSCPVRGSGDGGRA